MTDDPGFDEIKVEIQKPGQPKRTKVCSVNSPYIWYLDKDETVIAKLLRNGKEVGAAIIQTIFPEGKPT